MQELVKFIVMQIVANKENVEVEAKEDENELLLTVFVDENDIGKVIGRNGKTANSIRTIVKSASIETNKRVNIKFATREQHA